MQHIIDTGGEGIFILLEGFNEVPEELQKHSVYVKLIKGEILPQATVLITSQPLHTLKELMDCTYVH